MILSKFCKTLACTMLAPPTLSASVREKLASGEMIVVGDQWLLLVYADQQYDPDDPWDGLFRSNLLVCVGHNFLVGFLHH